MHQLHDGAGLVVEAYDERARARVPFRARHNATNTLRRSAPIGLSGFRSPMQPVGCGTPGSPLARGGGSSPGRRAPHQRRVQRQPRRHGLGARPPVRPRRGSSYGRRPRRHGRARTDGPAYHREVGAAAVQAGVVVLVAVGPLARGYIEGAGGVQVTRWAANAEGGLRRSGAPRARGLRAREGLPLGGSKPSPTPWFSPN